MVKYLFTLFVREVVKNIKREECELFWGVEIGTFLLNDFCFALKGNMTKVPKFGGNIIIFLKIPKGAVAFGHSGDEIVVRRHIQ